MAPNPTKLQRKQKSVVDKLIRERILSVSGISEMLYEELFGAELLFAEVTTNSSYEPANHPN